MHFSRILPSESLADIVECFWIVKNDDATPQIQKIIPDGFTEMIFHFGDPYKVRLNDRWELQPTDLLAGQIKRFFHLQNTGVSDIFGIKFKPAAITHLFGISMYRLTDRVAGISESLGEDVAGWRSAVRSTDDDKKRVAIIEELLMAVRPPATSEMPVEKAIRHIFKARGSVTVAELCFVSGLHERQLERSFRKHVGLSPKFFTRIIRFSTIFELVKEKDIRGSELGLESGFYDQSHFIRNFKAFTGEDPSQYFFDQPNLANFFMKKE